MPTLYVYHYFQKREWKKKKKKQEAVKKLRSSKDVALVSKSFMDKNCLKKNVSCLFQPERVKEGH